MQSSSSVQFVNSVSVTPGDAVAQEVASAIEQCRAALETPEMRAVLAALQSRGLAAADCVAMIERVGREPGAAERVAELRRTMSIDAPRPAPLERCLLLQAVRRYSAIAPFLSLGEGVRGCLCGELRFLADPSARDHANLLAPLDGFVSMAKVVTLRRFPAGQLHFELSGIPLSWLLRLSPWSLTRLLLFLARKVGGRAPFFFHHIAWRRRHRLFLCEREQNRSYFRIAQALAVQPEVKGLLTASWLHSPDTFQVSPHLAWLNKPFVEHGGLVVVVGKASESSGALAGSPERKRLYEEGRFRPTIAMAIWPRAAMLEWASGHPEFGGAG